PGPRSGRGGVSLGERERRRLGALPGRLPPGLISFAGGMPDSAMFPTDAFRRVLNAVIREEGEELLQYYPAAGYPPLRRFLSGYLLRFGVEALPDDILIVNGSQQGFDLIARTLLDPGDVVAIEEPTYPSAMHVFRAFGAPLAPGAGPARTRDLHRDVLEDPVPRVAARLARGAAPAARAAGGGQAARGPADERPDPGRGLSLLPAPAARAASGPDRRRVPAPPA